MIDEKGTKLTRPLSVDSGQTVALGATGDHLRQDAFESSHRRSRSLAEQGEGCDQPRRASKDFGDHKFKQHRPARLHTPPRHRHSYPERHSPLSPTFDTAAHLRRRVGELETSLAETQEALEIEHRVAIKKEKEFNEVSDEKGRLRAELDGIQALRAFSTSDSEPDSEHLIKAFYDLNTGVHELALQVARGLHPDDLTVQLHPASVETFLRRNVKAHVFLRSMLMRGASAGVAIQDVIVPLCQCIVHSFLAEFIFWPFFPGLVGAQNEFFYNLRDRIYSQESQEKAARWRAITYKAAASDRNNEALAGHMTTQFFALLADLLRTLLPPGNFSPEDLFPSLIPRAAGLVISAMQWQDTARTEYTSYDYDVFFPVPGAPILPDEMELVQLGQAAGQAIGTQTQSAQMVLLPLSLGMRATRSQAASSGDSTDCRTITKSSVLAI